MRTVLSIMRVSQQLVQAVSRYTKDSPFLQIPHFTAREAAYCLGRKTRIHSIRDFIKQPDDKIRSILRSFTPEQLNDVAAFNATFPLLQIDTSFEIKDGTINSEGNSIITPGSLVTVTITLRRQRFEEVRAETELALVEAEEKTEVLDEDKAIAKYLVGGRVRDEEGLEERGGRSRGSKNSPHHRDRYRARSRARRRASPARAERPRARRARRRPRLDRQRPAPDPRPALPAASPRARRARRATTSRLRRSRWSPPRLPILAAPALTTATVGVAVCRV